MNKKLKYILLYIIFSSLVTMLIWIEKEHKINTHLKLESTQIEKNYQAIYNEYKQLATVIFDTKINTKEITSIFQDAYKSTPAVQEQTRKKLYDHLLLAYNLLHTYNIKQLHFHLPDNSSFLRFHRPEKYGDDLSNIRETVKYVNKYKKPIDGFEEGRIYDGYRFVFPMFKDEDNSYIGSVEISFSTIAFIKTYQKSFTDFANFLIPKKNVEKKYLKMRKRTIHHFTCPLFISKKRLQS